MEYNLDGNSDSEGYQNECIGDNESIVPDSDPNSSYIEVLSVGFSEVSSYYTYLGNELDDNGPNTINDATVTSSVNMPNWTTNFTDITTEPFTWESDPCLPENIDVSVATALDYFNLLFKPEIFSDIKDHTSNYAIFKQEEIQTNRNNPDYVDNVWQETTVEELKALFGINILMGLNPLPQSKLNWHQNDFIGYSGVKRMMAYRKYQKLPQYLHVSDRANEPAWNSADYDKLYKICPVLNIAQDSFAESWKSGQNQTIDEGVIALRKDLSYVQYLPAKPIKRGIKVWMHCDADTTYLHQSEVYLGWQKKLEFGFGYYVVMKLCKDK